MSAVSDPIEYPGIDPEMAAAMMQSRSLLPEGKLDVTKAPISQVREQYARERRYWNEDGPEMARTEDGAIPGPHGEIPLRLYYPAAAAEAAEALPLMFYFHGGGFVYGGIETHDRISRWVAERLGAAFCSVDYRLAPEHKFPTPIDEAIAVLDWAAGNAGELGIDAARIGMGGDSAGAAISLATAYSLKQAGRADVLKLLVLVYGNYGLKESQSIALYGGPEYGLSDANRKFYRASYVGTDPKLHEDKRLNLLAADLSGVPACHIAAAEMDPLCDNSPALAEKLDEAGVANTCTIYPGVLHGFLHLTRMVAKSRQALDDAGDAIAAGL
ncbi:MAG: alpha/beta hydrolase fold domain-containing protein [Alphaproteobacteria bacterium]|nr:alpha/beta hydrolase fold domain-containing protein [Alphaproteobacteria bacterium]